MKAPLNQSNEPPPQVAAGRDAVDHFQQVYNRLNIDNLELLRQIYSDDVHFIDPIHEIRGLSPLKSYFKRMYSNAEHTSFSFDHQEVIGNRCLLQWRMALQHHKLNGGQRFSIEGVSLLHFSDAGKVTYHRDYYDLGTLIYERIPLVGSLIRYLKGRLSK